MQEKRTNRITKDAKHQTSSVQATQRQGKLVDAMYFDASGAKNTCIEVGRAIHCDRYKGNDKVSYTLKNLLIFWRHVEARSQTSGVTLDPLQKVRYLNNNYLLTLAICRETKGNKLINAANPIKSFSYFR